MDLSPLPILTKQMSETAETQRTQRARPRPHPHAHRTTAIDGPLGETAWMDTLGRASRLEMQENRSTRETALTLVEVLVVVGVLFVLAAMVLPSPGRGSGRAPGINCANNFKQVSLAFRIWAGDNGDQYPMRVSVTNGGTMELVASGTVW